MNGRYSFVLDIDGVFTDGTFYYTEQGKVMKKFGADDNDALKLISHDLDVFLVSGDWRSFPISSLRARDMGYELLNVNGGIGRVDWMHKRFGSDLSHVIYMGDAFTDAVVLKNAGYGICPSDASEYAKRYADYVCHAEGGHRAVAEAVFHIEGRFFHKSFEEAVGIV